MPPTEIGGLPAHILLVHLAVVAVPLAAALTVLSVLWPAARRKLGVLTPVVAAVALVVVPVTTHAGEWLQARVTPSPLIERHVHLGHELLPWAAGLFVVSAGQWIWFRRRPQPLGANTAVAVNVAAAVLALVVGVGSVVQVYRIGESGSKAVWTNSFSSAPRSGR